MTARVDLPLGHEYEPFGEQNGTCLLCHHESHGLCHQPEIAHHRPASEPEPSIHVLRGCKYAEGHSGPCVPWKPAKPQPTDKYEAMARELRQALNSLPDHYEPGADGGLYHALPPEGADRLIVALIRSVAQEAEAEGRRKEVEDIRQRLLVKYGR